MSRQEGHVLGLSDHLKPSPAVQKRAPGITEGQPTGVDCTMSIRLQVSRCYSSHWEALPTPHYTKREALLTGLLAQGARELLSELSSLRKTKGSLPSAQCQGAQAGTQAVALSSFFLSHFFFSNRKMVLLG